MYLSMLTLLLSFISLSSQSPTDTDGIRNTLARWSFLLDTQNFTSLSQVFTQNATLILPPPFGTYIGLSAIEAILQKAAGNDTTVHALTWQEVEVVEKEKASARTGFADNHFGTGADAGKLRTLWGYYVDDLVRIEGGWRIEKRETLATAGPFYSVSTQ